MGSNLSNEYWMDFFKLFCCKHRIVSLVITDIGYKEAGMNHL